MDEKPDVLQVHMTETGPLWRAALNGQELNKVVSVKIEQATGELPLVTLIIRVNEVKGFDS